MKSTSKCYDTVTEKYYREAELWQRDECTSCYCGNDRKPVCSQTSCPPVFCEAPMKIEQRCCPVCPAIIQQGGREAYFLFFNLSDAISRWRFSVIGPFLLKRFFSVQHFVQFVSVSQRLKLIEYWWMPAYFELSCCDHLCSIPYSFSHHPVASAATGARNCSPVISSRNYDSSWSTADEGDALQLAAQLCVILKQLNEVLCISGCMYDGKKFLHGDLKLLQDKCTLWWVLMYWWSWFIIQHKMLWSKKPDYLLRFIS